MNFSASNIVLTIASKSAVLPRGTIGGGELCKENRKLITNSEKNTYNY